LETIAVRVRGGVYEMGLRRKGGTRRLKEDEGES